MGIPTSGKYVIASIDLAQRHTAAAVMTSDGVRTWTGTVDVGPLEVGLEARWAVMRPFLLEFAGEIASMRVGECLLLVEDVHPRMINSKPAVKLQALTTHELAHLDPRMILANRWQRHLGYKKVKGRSTKGWAKELCEGIPGYEDPEGYNAKQREDVRDATLICHWARTCPETVEKESTIP